jgi:integrase
LSEEKTVAVLARLEDPYLLINETCISAGPRISEVLGLQIRHLDLDNGTLRVEQRNWHQDIGKPKTEQSKAHAGYRPPGRALPRMARKAASLTVLPQLR